MTVLFATLNGAHALPGMLDTLEGLESPARGWKFILVKFGLKMRAFGFDLIGNREKRV
jgi:hypothetical protein